MNFKKAEKLAKKGKEALETGDFQAAAEAFAKLLKLEDSTPVRNNLAFAIFMGGEPRRALEVLEPLLSPENESSQANPFTFALAARIHCSLGREDQARRLLQQAVRRFDEGLAALRRTKQVQDLHSFREYTVIIMRAAGDLRDHRLVYDLYRRWESQHVSWENSFLAAVACFNMGRYKQAASLWSSIAHVHRLFSAMAQAAFLIERGVVPPFEMGYELYSNEEIQKMFREAATNEETRYRFVEEGFFRTIMLGWILEDQESRGARQALYNLVYYGGEWGEKLGRQVLEGSGFSLPLKMSAANALMERGILPEGEPVPMVIDGEQRMIQLQIKSISIVEGRDEKLDEVVRQAISLRDRGQVEEAATLLRSLYLEGKFYPPAMLTLANLLRQQGELEEARQILETLEEMAPEEPVVLFNLAGLMLQLEEPERARSYFERIDPSKATEEVRSKLKMLEKEIEKAERGAYFLPPVDQLVQSFMEDLRREIEEKPLPVDAPLARGLKNMPARWLTGACQAYGLKPSPHRREREKQLAEFLSRRENLAKAVEVLDGKARKLLTYLLRQGGWSRLNAVTRKFGSMDGDGFYWEEQAPESPLGVLWSRALAMVGRASLAGRSCKIVTIPAELREPLKEILHL